MKLEPTLCLPAGALRRWARLPPTPAAWMGAAALGAGEPLPSGCFSMAAGPGLKVEPSRRVHEDWGTGAARSGSGLQRLLAVEPDAWVHFTSPGVMKLHVALP